MPAVFISLLLFPGAMLYMLFVRRGAFNDMLYAVALALFLGEGELVDLLLVVCLWRLILFLRL